MNFRLRQMEVFLMWMFIIEEKLTQQKEIRDSPLALRLVDSTRYDGLPVRRTQRTGSPLYQYQCAVVEVAETLGC